MEPVRRWGALLLGLLAVAELAGRLAITSTAPAVRTAVQTFVTGPNIHIVGTQASVSAAGAIAAFLLCLLGTLPLAFLRPAPAAVMISIASVLSLTLFETLTVAGLIAQLLAVYRLGRGGTARGSQFLAVALTAPFLVLALAGSPAMETRLLFVVLASLAPAVALVGVAQRREAMARGAVEQVMAGTEFEHMARGERARIARELHDVVAHHISMVSVQAETARLATPGMPELGARRLMEIGDTARAGLTEMRRLLGVLREDAMAASPDEPGGPARRAERQPQPGLPQLNDLLDEARDASGTGIRLIVSGTVARLDRGVELAAYRIAQEALTNARRHAPGAAVDVELHYGRDQLRLRIRDNGPGAPVTLDGAAPHAAAGGHGLVGMRERAQAAGGRLRAGTAAGGGFLVEATLPVTGQRAGAAA